MCRVQCGLWLEDSWHATTLHEQQRFVNYARGKNVTVDRHHEPLSIEDRHDLTGSKNATLLGLSPAVCIKANPDDGCFYCEAETIQRANVKPLCIVIDHESMRPSGAK